MRANRSLRVFFVAWALLAALSGAWAIATPIGAAPDEPAHLIKAASVVRGQFVGEPGAKGQVVRVPQYIAFTQNQTCYAFKPDVSADCMTDAPGDPAAMTEASTTAGLYNPVYYVLVGWPSLVSPDVGGVYAMRLASVVIVSMFLALSLALISRWRRPTLPLLAFAVAATPMVLFLSGSVNPNSLEIAATLAAFVGLISAVRFPDATRLPVISAVVFATAAIAANMRGLSLLWLAVALAFPFVLAKGADIRALLRSRSVRLAVAGTVVAGALAAVWLLSTNSLGAALEAQAPVVDAPAVGSSPVSGFVWTLLSTFTYSEGLVGVFGWLDTPAPEFVFFAWSTFVGMLVVLAIALLRGRTMAFAVALLAALALLPPVVQAAYIGGGGIIWQGRYILPVFVCVVVGIGAVLTDRLELPRSVTRRVVAVVVAVWGAAQAYSFATALRRYAVGLDAGWLELLHPRWAPPGGIAAWLAVFAVLAAVAAVAGYRLVVATRSASSVPIGE